MYISRTTMTCTRTTVAASTFSTQYSTGRYSGMLHSIVVLNSRAAAKGALWLFRENSTDEAVFKLAAPSTLVHTYYPRRTIDDSSKASTALDRIAFCNDRLKVHISATSDWHKLSTAYINLTMYWEGQGIY